MRWVKDYCIPRIQIVPNAWGKRGNLIVRVFWFAPHFRNCVFDFTRVYSLSNGQPSVHLKIFGRDLIKRNWHIFEA